MLRPIDNSQAAVYIPFVVVSHKVVTLVGFAHQDTWYVNVHQSISCSTIIVQWYISKEMRVFFIKPVS